MASTESTTVVQTVACDLGQCHHCKGQVVSLTAPAGQLCTHDCHGGDDLAIEARLEREHFGDVACSAPSCT